MFSLRGLVRKAALALWVHYFGFPPYRLNNMFDKVSKKSLKSPQRHISMGAIPSNIAVGPLGFLAELATTKSKQTVVPIMIWKRMTLIRLWR